MASSSKRRQTMAKLARERSVKERRARKQERKEDRKLAQAAAEAPDADDVLPGDETDPAPEASPDAAGRDGG